MINRFVVSKLELSDEKVADRIPVGEGGGMIVGVSDVVKGR